MFLLRSIFFVLLIVATHTVCAISNVNITLHPTETAVRVEGLNHEQIADLAQLTELEMRSALSVVISNTYPSEADFVIYVVGKVDFASDHISFVPSQPLNPQQEYYLSLSLLPIGEKLMIEEKFTLATLLSGDEPSIVHVMPGSTQIPANLTRFEVVFSEPMQRDFPNASIQILNAQQEPLYLLNTLMQLQWSDDDTRLYITLPNYVSQPSRTSYTSERFAIRLLNINGALSNKAGEPMRRDYQKPFYVLPIDTQSPQPSRWALDVPTKGSKQGFEIHFDEPLDIASLQKGVKVLSENGEQVKGKVLISHPQHSWHFIPSKAWGKGPYKVIVSSALSDLSGNKLGTSVELEFAPE